MQIVNLDLMKNPLNWAVIFLMLVIAAIGGHLVMSYTGFEPAK
jgi:hypothetical protein